MDYSVIAVKLEMPAKCHEKKMNQQDLNLFSYLKKYSKQRIRDLSSKVR